MMIDVVTEEMGRTECSTRTISSEPKVGLANFN